MKISSSSSTKPMSPISPGWFRPREKPVTGSVIFSSAFLTTLPQEPDFAGRGFLAKAGHMVRTGPASVIPYPCPKVACGIRRCSASSSSFPSGAAPERTILMELRSNFSTRGVFARDRTMGGTTAATVTRCFSIRSAAR
ncbi:unnamed protein product [Spirodela intermedia]|uniref:Uncharacterized protein n=1 Tax=Spirodela intermedia TaxID=51605 RepID=A0A7I8JHH6_SPIIN|nr:unnamed protein product [Spirodela intermedia]CAA6669619.1 unnamed protein product [Spirodela intermedia]